MGETAIVIALILIGAMGLGTWIASYITVSAASEKSHDRDKLPGIGWFIFLQALTVFLFFIAANLGALVNWGNH